MADNPFFSPQTSQLVIDAELPDYFTLFGIAPPCISIDQQRIEERFEDLMMSIHPDLFVGSSPEVQAASLRYATYAQEGKKILSEPFDCALYLLKLSNLAPESHQLQPPQDFILRIFELQDLALSEITPATAAQIRRLHTEVCSEVNAKLDHARLGDPQDVSEDELQSLYASIGKLKFAKNIFSLLQA